MSLSIGQSNTFFDGWAPYSGAVSRNTATRMNVPSDATLRHEIGEFVRLKQGGGFKYFVIYGKAATTLDLFGGSDYTLAAAGITDLAFSKFNTAVGLPGGWNWAPTLTGWSANPTNSAYRVSTSGRRADVMVDQGTAGTSNGTGITISAPFTAATVTNGFWGNVFWEGRDNGAVLAAPGRVFIGSAGTVFTVNKDLAGGNWTAANGKSVGFSMWYEF